MATNRCLQEYSKKVVAQLKEINKTNIFEQGGLSKLISQVGDMKRDQKGIYNLVIPRDNPLRIINPDHSVISNIDISCDIKGTINVKDVIEFEKYSVEVNLWSDKPDYCYREDLDSESIGQMVRSCLASGENFKRIFLRFHFDMKDKESKFPEPLFHFHVGGESVDKSCYMWMPNDLSEPRIPYPPMDPLLIIDLILRNFCLRSSYKVIETPTWKSEIKRCHDIFQRCYDQFSLHESFFCGVS
jgi:hypothetical protein